MGKEEQKQETKRDLVNNDHDNSEPQTFYEPISGGGKGKGKQKPKTKNDPVNNDLANTDPQNTEPSLNFRQSDSSLNDSGFDFQ